MPPSLLLTIRLFSFFSVYLHNTHPYFLLRHSSEVPQVPGCRRRLFPVRDALLVADSPWPGRHRSPAPHSARLSRPGLDTSTPNPGPRLDASSSSVMAPSPIRGPGDASQWADGSPGVGETSVDDIFAPSPDGSVVAPSDLSLVSSSDGMGAAHVDSTAASDTGYDLSGELLN